MEKAQVSSYEMECIIFSPKFLCGMCFVKRQHGELINNNEAMKRKASPYM